MDQQAKDWTTQRGVSGAPDRLPLPARDAAMALGVSERTIRRAIARGELPAAKQAGVYRIAPADLARYGTPRRRATLSRLIPFLVREDAPALDVQRSLTPLTGRERELAAIRDLVLHVDRPEGTRLVALTGPGGAGKIRLAMQVARRQGEERIVLDGVAVLVDHNLLRVEPGLGDEPRYLTLETVREFGLEQLAAIGEVKPARSAHAGYFGTLDERLDPNHLEFGGRLDDRLRWIEAEHPNLLAALDWMARTGDAEGVLRLAGSLAAFWRHRGYLREGQRWLEWALERTADAPARWRGRATAGLSLVLYPQRNIARAAPVPGPSPSSASTYARRSRPAVGVLEYEP